MLCSWVKQQGSLCLRQDLSASVSGERLKKQSSQRAVAQPGGHSVATNRASKQLGLGNAHAKASQLQTVHEPRHHTENPRPLPTATVALYDGER